MMGQPYVLKKILFATDLSDHARQAFNYAASLAALSGAEVTILNVIQPASPNIEALIVNLLGQERWNALRQEREFEIKETLVGKRKNAEAILEALGLFKDTALQDMGAAGRGVPSVEIVVTRGEVAEEIVAWSTKLECDLIVMGTRQSGFFSRGGKDPVEQVMKKTRIPVFLVPRQI